ncbi:MAG: hypothetical protein ABL866_04135 [Devosia sp.]
MNRAFFIRGFVAVVVLAGLTGEAMADGGSGNSGSNDDEKDDNSGPGGGGDDDEDDGDDDGEDDDPEDEDPNDDHNEARDAVVADNALPLDKILEIFRAGGDRVVIDVRLVHRRGVLSYLVKFIDFDGQVRKTYFDAMTGLQIS